MGKKKSLMCKNIRRLKSREKKFDHSGDYLITFTTLFGLTANTWINLITPKQEKYIFNILIAMLLEAFYIAAISIKVTSHYSVKAYIKDYKNEEKYQLVITKNLSLSATKFNKLVNLSLATKRIDLARRIDIILTITMIIFLTLITYIIPKYTAVWVMIVISLIYMGIIFPILFILLVTAVCQYFLLTDIKENWFTKLIKFIFGYTNH